MHEQTGPVARIPLKGQTANILLLLMLLIGLLLSAKPGHALESTAGSPRIIYITSDTRIPFWNVLSRGIHRQATALGYQVETLNAQNHARTELELVAGAIRQQVDGIIISPTNSSAAATLIKLSAKADIPVVIADIGADSDRYVAYISADNRGGAYAIGTILTRALEQRDWQQGRVGIIAIPQKRLNGQQRTAGFMQALDEAGIQNAAMRQQVDFSHDETYRFTRELITTVPDLRAIWLQGSDRYQAALDALADTGKQDDVLLVTFDAEPDFLQLIPDGVLVGAAMQQPYLMGEKAVMALHDHLQGKAVVPEQKLPVLAISADNIGANLALIRRNVLGLETTP